MNQYQELFERSADAILILDGETFVDCNEATVRMLRYGSKNDLLQTHPSELSPVRQPDGRNSFEKAGEMIAIARERGSHRFDWEHRRADGEVFPVEVLLTPIQSGEKTLVHVVWREISERKRLEKELRHAQKLEAIGKLAGGIAHDFNNLLVVILGNAEMLESDLEQLPELQEQVREIKHAGERAAKLTSQLLAFSRRQDLKPAVVDFHDIVNNLGRMIRRLVGEDITMVFERDESDLPVKVDPGQIEQVILNLVTNARDAMGDGGPLTLKTCRKEQYAVLRVTDSGSGMSDAVLARAMEPFFTTKAVGRGTGLGLSSAYGIVRQSGGEMHLSTTEGSGTTVEILLPISTDQVASQPQEDRTPGGFSPGYGTVLVVEDDPGVARLVRAALIREGYRVLEASNGGAAMRCLENHEGDIRMVLTDVVMPIMSGPELVRQLREKWPSLPALFMSGYTDDTLASHGLNPERVDLLQKPFSSTVLLNIVRKFLSSRDAVSDAPQENERQDM